MAYDVFISYRRQGGDVDYQYGVGSLYAGGWASLAILRLHFAGLSARREATTARRKTLVSYIADATSESENDHV